MKAVQLRSVCFLSSCSYLHQIIEAQAFRNAELESTVYTLTHRPKTPSSGSQLSNISSNPSSAASPVVQTGSNPTAFNSLAPSYPDSPDGTGSFQFQSVYGLKPDVPLHFEHVQPAQQAYGYAHAHGHQAITSPMSTTSLSPPSLLFHSWMGEGNKRPPVGESPKPTGSSEEEYRGRSTDRRFESGVGGEWIDVPSGAARGIGMNGRRGSGDSMVE